MISSPDGGFQSELFSLAPSLKGEFYVSLVQE